MIFMALMKSVLTATANGMTQQRCFPFASLPLNQSNLFPHQGRLAFEQSDACLIDIDAPNIPDSVLLHDFPQYFLPPGNLLVARRQQLLLPS
jgi:hypothetical protein